MMNLTLTFSQEDFDNYALSFEELVDWDNPIPENSVLNFLGQMFELEEKDLEVFYQWVSEQDKKKLWNEILKAIKNNCSSGALGEYVEYTQY